tara:strand:- start:53 stop:301 length:249 start_codon:yes stop_codon:yes gene_type:complete
LAETRETEKDLDPYVLRHRYAKKAHMKYKLTVPEVALLMRHSVNLHNHNCSQSVTHDNIEVSVSSAIAEAVKSSKYNLLADN